MNQVGIGMWLGFIVFVLLALSADSFFSKSSQRSQSISKALLSTTIWIACALIFNGILWIYFYDSTNLAVANEKALVFFTGYLIEKTLSLDNLFAFYIVFKSFQIPTHY